MVTDGRCGEKNNNFRTDYRFALRTPAVEMMTGFGSPMVKGAGRFGSEKDLYVGNGDTVTFA